ncbi:MAG: phage tail sheath subtilisin-like domain-containing protein [Pirellulales bacterium]|nr:phage tail sheath subtilisin-like domain-containing protein [Pirellulales bacterium]
MPTTPSYPGVYIEEIPSGVRTIVGVATSITAFVGRARRGPTDEPTMIHNFGEFERQFGGLWSESKLGFAVRDFFLNGGSDALIVRLFNPKDPQLKPQATKGAELVAAAAENEANRTGDTPPTAASVIAKAKDAIPDTAGVAHDAGQQVYEAIKNNTTEPDAKKVAAVARNAVGPAVTSALDTAYTKTHAVIQGKAAGVVKWTMEAKYPGQWGNKLRVRVDDLVAPAAAEQLKVTKEDLFNLEIRDTESGAVERFRNLTVVESPRRVDRVLKAESNLIQMECPTTVPEKHAPYSEADRKKPLSELLEMEEYWARSDGSAGDGGPLDEATILADLDAKSGLYALEKADLFNLLCIPPFNVTQDSVTRIEQELKPKASFHDAVAKYCLDRRALYLIDAPDDWADKSTVVKDVGSSSSTIGAPHRNAAVFFPRLRQPNPLRENQAESFVPCGTVAGVFARTDAQRGVWKAPAGLDASILGAVGLTVNLTDAENGELNPLGVNCLRTMPGAGRVIWGSRTRVGDDRLASEWKYIPIRRTTLFIEESLYRGTQWVVFEPNDEPLWAQIRLNVGAFMHRLFRQGAFQGRTPREAYFVKCDNETNPQTDINLGIVNIHVGFAPLRPAEFVIIKIQQMAGQIETG